MTSLLGTPALALADTWIGGTTSLPKANPATVEAWLESLSPLGGQPMTLSWDLQAPANCDFSCLKSLQSPYEWDYAVVKYGGNYVVIRDDSPNNNVFDIDNLRLPDGSLFKLSYNVSNVRFFVPEPTALLLLGTGLVAAAPFVWSRRRRV
jgi:hypothetical protein